MRLSQKVLKKRFKKFNELYFGGDLEEPKFVIIGSRWLAGMFNCTYYTSKDENGEEYATSLNNLKIRLSKKLIKNSDILDNILLHEMIHYYGYYMNEDIAGEHGKFFKKWARKVNKDGYKVKKYYEG